MTVNIGINDNNSWHTKLTEIRDNIPMIKEIKFTIALVNPQFDFRYFDQALFDVDKLFRGNYPGYRACNTDYHDLRHTLHAQH